MEDYVRNVVEWSPYLWLGTATTLQVTSAAVVLGIGLGIGLAYAQISSFRVLRIVAGLYVEFMRGIPVLALLFLLYFGLPAVGVTLTPIVAGALGLGLNAAAYSAEFFRSSILEVPRGLVEAADSIGLTPAWKARSVVLPIAVRNVLPPLTTFTVTILKDSSIVSTIAVADLMLHAQNIASRGLTGLQVHVTVGVIYVFLTLPVLLLGRELERRHGLAKAMGRAK